MPVVEIGTTSRFTGMPARPVLPTWYRARHLVGLVARSRLMVIDLEQGDTAQLTRHLTRIAMLAREARLFELAAEVERLQGRVSLPIAPEHVHALRQLHARILALSAGAGTH